MEQLQLTKPLCVVDCNFIQRCSGDDDDDVPLHWDCVLISSVFSELADKEDRERSFLFSRFTQWARRNASRLWMARDWKKLIRAHEWSARTAGRIGLADFISPALTLELREYARDPAAEWTAPLVIREVREWMDHAQKGQAHFVSFTDKCRAFIDALEGARSEKIPHTPEAIRQYVQAFNIADAIIDRSGRGRYGDAKWRPHFAGFPDRLIVAKRMRLDLYYAIRRCLGDSRKFENNWHDIHYAIAASYTGHIATHDGRLRRACEVLSPGLRMFPRAMPDA